MASIINPIADCYVAWDKYDFLIYVMEYTCFRIVFRKVY